jgi:hypothetical protein
LSSAAERNAAVADISINEGPTRRWS